MFWKKSRALVEEVQGLLELCSSGLADFDKALHIYYKSGCSEEFIALTEKVKEWEDKADKQVYKIKHSLFGNFLLPESREDIARLLNKIDNIIDNAMHAIKFIALRNLPPVTELAELDKELRAGTLTCFKTTYETAKLLFAPRQWEKVRDMVEEVGAYESICDDVENRMIGRLYELPIEDARRILQAQLVAQVGAVSDACEDAAGIMGIMNLKRAI
jgi:predicted phosphate transport protein (TIGR00153 family)